MADERLLIGEAEPARRSSAGDDEGAGQQLVAAQVDFDGLPAAVGGFAAEIDAGDVAGEEFRAETRGLHAHVVDELGPWMPSGKPGKFSTSVVMESWPPGSWPSMTSGVRLARAA